MRTFQLFLGCALLSALSRAQGPAGQPDTVALIIGGISNDPSRASSSVELFGCPNQGSVIFGNLPAGPTYLSGGAYIDSLEAALICGGFSVSGSGAGATKMCYTLNENAIFSLTGDLVESRWGHIIATGPNLNSPAGGDQPIVLGSGTSTEIFDGEAWSEYLDLVSPNGERFTSLGCLVQHEDVVYSVGRTVQALDLNDWTISSLGASPVENKGKCAITEVNGNAGESGHFLAS